MNRYRPMSKAQLNNKLSLAKIYKNKFINRQNLSSFQHRSNVNSSAKAYMTNYMQYKFKPKLFSLLDINDKITNSRGTVLPQQYKRLSQEENKRLFGFSYRTDRSYDFSKIRQILGSASPSSKKKMADEKKINEIEKKIYNRYNSDIWEYIKNRKNKFPKKDKIEENKKIKIEENDNKINGNNSYNNINLNMNQKNILEKEEKKRSESNKNQKRAKEEKKNMEQEKLIIRNTKDRWLPKGYAKYELLVKNQKIFMKQLK